MVVVVIAMAAGAVGAAGGLRQIVVTNAERAVFSESCEYYQTRVRSAPGESPRRATTGEFVAFLASACAAAEISLDTGTPEQQARAALLLSRIALLSDTIGRMNAERGARAAARLNGVGAGETGAATISRVTLSGEFLIAHRMGIMIAFDAWLDSGVDFSLASYR